MAKIKEIKLDPLVTTALCVLAFVIGYLIGYVA